VPPHFTQDPGFRVHFLGIGAPKGGTTWLSAVLGAHPDLFTPPGKEVEYFNHHRTEYDLPNANFRRPPAWYHAHFRGARPGQVVGEINPTYLLPVTDPRDIHRYHPGLKLLAILRDPVERARSQFQFSAKWWSGVPPTFAEALERHPEFLAQGEYGRLLQRYYDLFPAGQILVLFHEDLRRDALAVYRQATRFLGVADFDPPNLHDRPNETRTVRSGALGAALGKGREWMYRLGLENTRPWLRRIGVLRAVEWLREEVNAGPPPPPVEIPPALERALRDRFTPDIEHLERLTGRDLAHWKSGAC
jgi:predicted DNA-binding transcriptional regulator AlpA